MTVTDASDHAVVTTQLDGMNNDQLSELIRDAGKIIAKRAQDIRQFENESLVGRSFKYRNSYSCPQEEKDYWMLYQRVLSLDHDGTPWGVTIQTDCYGKMECEEGPIRSIGDEIETEEFDKAAEKFRETVSFRLS